MLKKMAQYRYHYGLKVRIYPSLQQKEIIRESANASRFVYNISHHLEDSMKWHIVEAI